ncbi:S-type pyocin domain-containing protein [Pseudomonas sp. PDM27]|uniref:S-type pyocin domain-containing protein n=1 Tax=Pseudomonas sp. PDM27 TaxID=2854769 RepID=UPI00210C5A80|nr:S-type pyocin domain-containing protein [Pseudomonas sp. PDM27]
MKTDREFQTRTEQIAQSIEQDLAATRLEGPTHPLPPAQAIIRELGIRNTLIARKTAEAHQKTLLSHQFFGDTPLNKDFHDYYRKAQSIDSKVSPKGIAMQAWAASYRAAHEANLLTLSIQMLNQQQVEVYKWLATVQANDQEQAAAAAEAQRIAAEQARIRAESEALALAQEQARLAALAEAERVAAEQARIAAEAAARYIAAEQARREAEAEVQRQVEALRLENQRLAEEEARRNAMESLNTAQTLRPFPVSGAAAASDPVFTVAAGTLAVDAATTLAIRAAVRSAAAAAITALAAVVGTASGVVIVAGVAALGYYALRDNKEPYALSVPLSDLTTYDVDELYAIAHTNGEVELSVAMGSKTMENTTEFVVATANGTTVPSKVPVRLATYDPGLNVYSVHHPDAPGASMTWTPIVRPGDASTELPVKEPNVVAYNGTTLKSLEGRVDTSPALDLYRFGGFICVFPTESGIAPQYVMFSSPYAGASVNGKYSGRAFNPEEAGGPILDLDWRTAVITQAGIDTVKLHIARLNQSDANDIMIQRLEKILSGHRELTDIDLRYYTHEIRELERYRAFGYGDDISPSEYSPIWNNAHTATLEDYKLGSELTLLYTKEAINAMNAQDQREYEKNMRSFGQ